MVNEKTDGGRIRGYAPGNYTCRCTLCACEFIGDKRAWQCKECAMKLPFTPEPAHSDLLSRLDATGQNEFSYDEDKEEAATTIRNLQAEIAKLNESSRKLHRRVQQAEAPAISIKAYKAMLLEVFGDLKCEPEKAEATIKAYEAGEGHSLQYHIEVAKYQIVLRHAAEKQNAALRADLTNLQAEIAALRDTMRANTQRAAESDRENARKIDRYRAALSAACTALRDNQMSALDHREQ